MKAVEKKKEELKFKPLSELQFDLPALKYDADAPQTIPFLTDIRTRDGIQTARVGHRLAPITDERFIEREREIKQQTDNKTFNDANLFSNSKPTEDLFDDVAIERIGFKERDDWKQVTETTDKLNSVFAVLVCDLITDEAEDALDDDFLVDDEQETCLRFKVFFGGIPLDDWKQWFESGHFPETFKDAFTPDVYESAIALIRRGISPSVRLEVRHFFGRETKAQMDEASAMFFGIPDRSKLASAARNGKTLSERWIDLYEQSCKSAEGYTGRIPNWNKVSAAKAYFELILANLGKFENR